MSIKPMELWSWTALPLLACFSSVFCQITCPDGFHFSEEHGQCVDTTDFIVDWVIQAIVLVMLFILLILVGCVCYRWWPRPEPLSKLAPDSSLDKPQEKPMLNKADGSTQSTSTRTEKTYPELAEDAVMIAEDQV